MKIGFLLSFARPYWPALAACTALMILGSGAALCVPWLGGQLAEQVLEKHSINRDLILWTLLLLFAVQAIVRFVTDYVLSAVAAKILADLRARVFDHLQALPLSFHQSHRKGDLLAIVTNEVEQLAHFLTGTLLSVVPMLLTTLGAMVLMMRIDLHLAGLVAVLIPSFYFILKFMSRGLRPLAQEVQAAEAQAVAVADECLSMLPAIKTFTRERLEAKRYLGSLRRVTQAQMSQQRIYAALEPTLQFIAAASVVWLLWLASSHIDANSMSPAQLVTFLMYAALMARPMSALSNVYGQTQIALGHLKRLEAVLAEPAEQIFRPGSPSLSDVRGRIEFRSVDFAYVGGAPVLTNVNLLVNPGETIALTGKNGSGKSTLVHLLMRLHEPKSGMILIDGIDIAQVGVTELRRVIGIVPQNVMLFNGSVRDNIGFGNAEASQQDIEEAARLAQAAEFITSLPDGYDTVVGDHGVRLSGGQRQRLALARALVKNPQILILDEPTAMFDPMGEAAVIDRCRATLAKRTVLLITHRPASLALADRIIHVSNGNLIEASKVGAKLATVR